MKDFGSGYTLRDAHIVILCFIEKARKCVRHIQLKPGILHNAPFIVRQKVPKWRRNCDQARTTSVASHIIIVQPFHSRNSCIPQKQPYFRIKNAPGVLFFVGGHYCCLSSPSLVVDTLRYRSPGTRVYHPTPHVGPAPSRNPINEVFCSTCPRLDSSP